MTIKHITKLITVLLLSLQCCFCYALGTQVKVNGMVCDFCARGLKGSMLELDGVENVVIDLANGTITMTHSKDINQSDIIDIVQRHGMAHVSSTKVSASEK